MFLLLLRAFLYLLCTHHLPLTLRSGYSSSSEEEKVKVLIILTFPSFFKGGVSCPKGHDGVVNHTSLTSPPFISYILLFA
jgi:hypothetical protein